MTPAAFLAILREELHAYAEELDHLVQGEAGARELRLLKLVAEAKGHYQKEALKTLLYRVEDRLNRLRPLE